MSVTDATHVLEVNQHLWMGAFEDRYAHNVAIYHPALAKLQHRIDTLDTQIDTGHEWTKIQTPESETPPRVKEFLHLAKTYFEESRDFYPTEDGLAQKLISILNQVFKLTGSPQKYSSTTGDKKKTSFTRGDNRVDCSWGPLSHLIAEFKLLFGMEGDASAQGDLWFGKHCHVGKVRVIVSSGLSMLIYRMRIGRCKVQV